MKVSREIKDKIENIFKELHIKYREIDLKDDDLNYWIYINVSGRFKAMDTIAGCLYLSADNYQMCLLVANIYKFNENEDINPFYKIVNDANAYTHGTFAITGERKQIIYRNSDYCGENFSELSIDGVKVQINTFICGLEKIFDAIKEQNND